MTIDGAVAAYPVVSYAGGQDRGDPVIPASVIGAPMSGVADSLSLLRAMFAVLTLAVPVAQAVGSESPVPPTNAEELVWDVEHPDTPQIARMLEERGTVLVQTVPRNQIFFPPAGEWIAVDHYEYCGILIALSGHLVHWERKERGEWAPVDNRELRSWREDIIAGTDARTRPPQIFLVPPGAYRLRAVGVSSWPMQSDWHELTSVAGETACVALRLRPRPARTFQLRLMDRKTGAGIEGVWGHFEDQGTVVPWYYTSPSSGRQSNQGSLWPVQIRDWITDDSGTIIARRRNGDPVSVYWWTDAPLRLFVGDERFVRCMQFQYGYEERPRPTVTAESFAEAAGQVISVPIDVPDVQVRARLMHWVDDESEGRILKPFLHDDVLAAYQQNPTGVPEDLGSNTGLAVIEVSETSKDAAIAPSANHRVYLNEVIAEMGHYDAATGWVTFRFLQPGRRYTFAGFLLLTYVGLRIESSSLTSFVCPAQQEVPLECEVILGNDFPERVPLPLAYRALGSDE